MLYNANSGVRRFRTPSVQDVLSGRGGSANAHPGNCQFRDFVAAHKMDYNLAGSNKDEKAEICMLVINKVRDLGGRFLVKESSGSAFWVELPEDRVMAKTSQALREGAPKIRREHANEISQKRRTPTATTTSPALKRVRVDYKGHAVLPSDATPPMTALPSPSYENVSEFALPGPKFPAPKSVLPRSNSLAHSDITVNPSYLEEFHNPFEDESEITGCMPPPPPQVGVLRESSVSSNTSDLAGFGALLRDEKMARSSSVSSWNRYAADDASVNTTSLPVWEWLEGAWDQPSLVSPQ